MKRPHVSIKHLLVCAMLLLFISGCAKTAYVAPNSQALSPTPMAMSTLTSTCAATVKPPFFSQAKNSCWKTQSVVNVSKNNIGSVLYFSPEIKSIVAYDVNSGYSKIISGTYLSIDISPDRSMFAYQGFKENKIEFISQFGSKVFPIPEDLYSDGFSANGNLRLGVTTALNQNYQEGVGTRDQYYLLSPDTRNFTSYSVSLPYFKNSQNRYAKYSPNLKYVVYPSLYQGKLGAILLDTKTEEIKWSGWKEGFLIGNFPSYPQPVWKFDSSAFTIVMPDQDKNARNIFNVPIEGKVSQLTHFEQIFNLPYDIGFLTWSPNGRYLALRLDFESDTVDSLKNNLLVIVDSQTGEVINPCLSLGRDITHPIGYPAWSPDGNHLAVVPRDESGLVIVDLTSREIYRLFDKPNMLSADLLGWMNWQIPK